MKKLLLGALLVTSVNSFAIDGRVDDINLTLDHMISTFGMAYELLTGQPVETLDKPYTYEQLRYDLVYLRDDIEKLEDKLVDAKNELKAIKKQQKKNKRKEKSELDIKVYLPTWACGPCTATQRGLEYDIAKFKEENPKDIFHYQEITLADHELKDLGIKAVPHIVVTNLKTNEKIEEAGAKSGSMLHEFMRDITSKDLIFGVSGLESDIELYSKSIKNNERDLQVALKLSDMIESQDFLSTCLQALKDSKTKLSNSRQHRVCSEVSLDNLTPLKCFIKKQTVGYRLYESDTLLDFKMCYTHTPEQNQELSEDIKRTALRDAFR